MNIKISGAAINDPLFRKLLTKLPLHQGAIFNSSNYKQAKQELFRLANRRGYLAAKMQRSEVRINLAHYTCLITMHFNSGPRYRFGRVVFKGSSFSN